MPATSGLISTLQLRLLSAFFMRARALSAEPVTARFYRRKGPAPARCKWVFSAHYSSDQQEHPVACWTIHAAETPSAIDELSHRLAFSDHDIARPRFPVKASKAITLTAIAVRFNEPNSASQPNLVKRE